LIFLGEILKTRGNKGEVVLGASPYFEIYAPLEGETIELQSEKYHIQLKIEYVREIQGSQVIKFEGINSINDAFKRIGYSLFSLRPPKTDEIPFTFEQSIDYVVKDISGNVWGTVLKTESYGFNQVLEIIGDTGSPILVPYSDGIIREIDEQNKLIIIDPPEGLKDLNRS